MSHNGRRVGLIFGGTSSEHLISVASARGVAEALDDLGCDIRLVRIDRSGVWRIVSSVDVADDESSDDGRADDADPSTAPPIGPQPALLRDLDVVFPVLHGVGGEDGTVQGLLELLGIPYVGCGVLSSALAMDKLMTSRLLAADGLPVIPTRCVTSVDDADDVVRGLDFPVFVKPNRAGSSVGASRVDSAAGLYAAVGAALAEDSTALIQPVVSGAEVSIGVLQYSDGTVAATGPSLLHLGDGQQFFSYDGKYGGGQTRLQIPAPLPATLIATLQNLAIAAFESINGTGLARVDFFVEGVDVADDTDSAPHIVINEINTLPGLGRTSHYPRLWQAAGVTHTDLVGELLATALRGAADTRSAKVSRPAGDVSAGGVSAARGGVSAGGAVAGAAASVRAGVVPAGSS